MPGVGQPVFEMTERGLHRNQLHVAFGGEGAKPGHIRGREGVTARGGVFVAGVVEGGLEVQQHVVDAHRR